MCVASLLYQKIIVLLYNKCYDFNGFENAPAQPEFFGELQI